LDEQEARNTARNLYSSIEGLHKRHRASVHAMTTRSAGQVRLRYSMSPPAAF